ncbi:response regulator transcription factor [Candidatus Peregrinibacteria bacterium]|nr:response regulator transcription factor [Candidatus Peregrinibacteria bacterium]
MKILLVEDDLRLAQLLTRNFKREGIEVRHETDGREALKILLNSSFDFVILDLILPGMRGEELLQEVRKKNKNVPIIILSAVEHCESRIRLFNLGADDYVTKPFHFDELMARVQSVLRRSSPEKQKHEEIVVGGLKIIPKMRLVYFQKKIVNLRPKEYSLLLYLARRPNQIVSRNMLIEQIWGYDAHPLSNMVDSHISILRKKIKIRPNQNLIRTVQGVGYLLETD